MNPVVATMPESKTRTAFRPELNVRQSVQVHAIAGYLSMSPPDFVRACVDAMLATMVQNDPVAAALLEAISEMN